MRKVFFIAGLLLLTAGIASASCPRFEVGGGYAYTRVGSEFGLSGGSGEGSSTSTNLNGWDAEADYDLTCWLAGVANFTGVYKSIDGAHAHVYTETFGPRVNLRNSTRFTPFVEALFGAGQFGVSFDGESASINAFSGMYGGGVDVNFGPTWAVRTQIGDVNTHFGGMFQNSFGLTAEVVIKFGNH
ncbi:MAG: outer membrane beta-barrel protein [Candidatus Acidiferrales bacterium]